MRAVSCICVLHSFQAGKCHSRTVWRSTLHHTGRTGRVRIACNMSAYVDDGTVIQQGKWRHRQGRYEHDRHRGLGQ